MRKSVSITRQVVVEMLYTLPVDNPTVAKQMLKKAEARGNPYKPDRVIVIKRGRFVVRDDI